MAALDLTGDVFGRLTAVRVDESRTTRGRGGKIVWECRCACGSTSYVQANNLRSGQSTTCGAPIHKSIPDGHPALYNKRYARYKASAIDRGLAFELSKEQFASIVKQPCHYCGVAHSMDPTDSGKHLNRTPINGIDRKDSRLGYVMANCLPCCGRCNEMKMDEDYETFIERMKRILVHLKRI